MRTVIGAIGLVVLLIGGGFFLIGAANGVNSIQYQMTGQFPDAARGQMGTGFVLAAVGGGLTWWSTRTPSHLKMPIED